MRRMERAPFNVMGGPWARNGWGGLGWGVGLGAVGASRMWELGEAWAVWAGGHQRSEERPRGGGAGAPRVAVG